MAALSKFGTFLRPRWVWLLLLWAGLPASAVAEPTMLAGEVAPFSYLREGKVTGLATDLVREMAKRAGHSGKMELVPFGRALKQAETEPDTLIFIIGRNAAREPLYQWVVNLVDEEFVIAASSASQVDISSFEAAAKLRTGVMRASVGANIAKGRGLLNIDETTAEETNAKKLAMGRLDAWVASWNTMLHAQRLAGLNPKELRRGAVALKVGLYLAASKSLDKAEADKWRAAYEAIKKDGTYARILQQYQYELPK